MDNRTFYSKEQLERIGAKLVESFLFRSGLNPEEKWLLTKTQCKRADVPVKEGEQIHYYKKGKTNSKGFTSYFPLYERTNQFNWITYQEFNANPYYITSPVKTNLKLSKNEAMLVGHVMGDEGFLRVYETKQTYYDPLKLYHISESERKQWRSIVPFPLNGQLLGEINGTKYYDVHEDFERNHLPLLENGANVSKIIIGNPYIVTAFQCMKELNIANGFERDLRLTLEDVQKECRSHVKVCYLHEGKLRAYYDASKLYKRMGIWFISQKQYEKRAYLSKLLPEFVFRAAKLKEEQNLKYHAFLLETREPVFDFRKLNGWERWKRMRIRVMMEHFKDI